MTMKKSPKPLKEQDLDRVVGGAGGTIDIESFSWGGTSAAPDAAPKSSAVKTGTSSSSDGGRG